MAAALFRGSPSADLGAIGGVALLMSSSEQPMAGEASDTLQALLLAFSQQGSIKQTRSMQAIQNIDPLTAHIPRQFLIP